MLLTRMRLENWPLEKKIKAKPWLTFAILRSVKIKNKMYKSLINKPNDLVNNEKC